MPPAAGRRDRPSTPKVAAKADGFERQSHGERTRQRILDAAVELFGTRGFRSTGVTALAEQVEMSGPGLLYYFGTKERLLEEVVAERDRVDQAGDAEFRLFALRRAGAHAVQTRRITQMFITLGVENIEGDQPLHAFFVRRYEERRQLLRRALSDEIERGTIRADVDIEQLAVEMPSMILGMEIHWLTDPDAFDISRAVERYFDRTIDALRVPTTKRPSTRRQRPESA